MRELKLNAIYRHYQGNYYRTLLTANNLQTPDSLLVIYQGVGLDTEYQPFWARDVSEFLGLHDGVNYRFELIEDDVDKLGFGDIIYPI